MKNFTPFFFAVCTYIISFIVLRYVSDESFLKYIASLLVVITMFYAIPLALVIGVIRMFREQDKKGEHEEKTLKVLGVDKRLSLENSIGQNILYFVGFCFFALVAFWADKNQSPGDLVSLITSITSAALSVIFLFRLMKKTK